MASTVESKLKTIVFIIGNGHSGSTILDMALGSSPNAFSLGEIDQLSRSIKRNIPCVCGVNIQQCPFWLGVSERLNKEHGIQLMDIRKPLDLKYKGSNTNLGCNFKRLYDAIFRQSKADVLIDSCKDYRRAFFLRRHLSDYRIAFIHLIRDVRGYVHSMKKTTFKCNVPGTEKIVELPRTPMSVEKSVKVWKYRNLAISFYLRLLMLKKSSYLVRYEDLAENPFEILSRLADWLGLSNPDQMIHFGSVVHHNVSGNPARFNSIKITPPSKRWEEKLTAAELAYVQKKAGFLNRLYGFQD